MKYLRYIKNRLHNLPVWWMKNSTINIHTSSDKNKPACRFRATS